MFVARALQVHSLLVLCVVLAALCVWRACSALCAESLLVVRDTAVLHSRHSYLLSSHTTYLAAQVSQVVLHEVFHHVCPFFCL